MTNTRVLDLVAVEGLVGPLAAASGQLHSSSALAERQFTSLLSYLFRLSLRSNSGSGRGWEVTREQLRVR